MIITIDVGNTNITVGVFNGDEIVASFRMTTKMPRTSDEYGMLLTNLLEQNRIHCDEIQDAIIASVVPNVMHSLEGAVIKSSREQKRESVSSQRIHVRSVQTVSWMLRQLMRFMAVRCSYLISVQPPLMTL